MSALGTLLVYLVIGAVVAVALRVATREGDPRVGVATTASWALLWPFYAPGVLGRAAGPATQPARRAPTPVVSGAPSRMQATRERFLATVSGLRGVAEDVIRPQAERIASMLDALDAAEARVREMNELLQTPELD